MAIQQRKRSSIAERRNKDSDAYGVGANRIAIDEHHARLFVNAAMRFYIICLYEGGMTI